MSAVWRRSAVLRFPASSRSHTLTRRGLGLLFLPAAGRKSTLPAICILKRGALARLVDSHTPTQAYTYALLHHVPSRRPFLSFPTQTHTVFHFTRLGCRTLSITERVSWRSDERSCLMSQLSEDRPGTPARESEIQPLRWEMQCGPQKELYYYCPVRPLCVWVLAGAGVKVLEADALHDSSRPLSQAIDCEREAAPKHSFLRPLIVSRYCSVSLFPLSGLLKVLFLLRY